jgi:creatinine amidohydrolase
MDRPTRVASGSVSDVAESLRAAGIDRLALINGHGGNYVLANVVQQANIAGLG